ncbi:unnamed protein product [Amaranthus hypochondriacus]
MGRLKYLTGTKAFKELAENPSSSQEEDEQDQPPITGLEPSKNKTQKRPKTIRILRSMIRSFPIVTPKPCRLPEINFRTNGTGNRVTGTLFGYKKGRMSFALQQTSKNIPNLLLDLPIQTHVFEKEMKSGMVRIALECEKRDEKEKKGLLEENVWDMFLNGKKCGYVLKREANEMDLSIMEVLKVITMGVGVLPNTDYYGGDDPDDELDYIRANFDHHVGSKDSETLYMLCPEGNSLLDLTIFFVRL